MTESANHGDVIQALEDVIASGVLGQKSRLPALLRFLVEETLAGRGDRLKAYVIGTDVFGRPESFDPNTDSIVRVEMNRLRQALNHHALTVGASAPLRIEIPKGRYQPVFVVEAPSAGISEPTNGVRQFSDVLGWLKQGKWQAVAIAGAAAVLLVFAGVIFWPRGEVVQTTSIHSLTLPPFEGPRIAVVPLVNLSDDKSQDNLAYGLSVDLVTELSRFNWLSVFVGNERYGNSYRKIDSAPLASLDADYILSGAIRADKNTFIATISLLESDSRTVLWSNAFKETLSAKTLIELQQSAAERIAVEVARPEGLVARFEERKVVRDTTLSLTAYGCVMQTYRYWRNFSSAEHLKARECLEEAIDADPNYSEAFAALAFIYLDEQRYGTNSRGSYDPLKKARQMAQRAMELNSFSTLAAQALFTVDAHRRNFSEMRRVASRAIRQSPNNPALLADYGTKLALLAGDWENGLVLVHRALSLNPDPPIWYFIVPAFEAYREFRFDESLAWADQMNAPDFFLYHVVRIASLVRLGQFSDASIQLEEFRQHGYPDFATFSAFLEASAIEPNLADALRADVKLVYDQAARS